MNVNVNTLSAFALAFVGKWVICEGRKRERQGGQVRRRRCEVNEGGWMDEGGPCQIVVMSMPPQGDGGGRRFSLILPVLTHSSQRQPAQLTRSAKALKKGVVSGGRTEKKGVHRARERDEER